jgi:D-erythronate 2-dehydrogenase
VKVLITGGTGFIGRRLAERLLRLDSLQIEGYPAARIEKITLFDAFHGDRQWSDPRVEVVTGEISDRETVTRVAQDADLIWHLAAIVSSDAEANFDLGMKVNLYGTLNLLEILRAKGRRPRLVNASSLAVFGGELPPVVTDRTDLTPKSSYGTQKAIGELLVADYTRKGFVDGRSLRLPTIAIRPGKPNKAASTFVSSIIREPLAQQTTVCPVRPDSPMCILSGRRVVDAMIRAMTLSYEAVGSERTILLPGFTLTVAEMVRVLEKVAGPEATKLIHWQPDPGIQRLVDSWPERIDAARANALGFECDKDFEEVVRAHIEDEAVPQWWRT